MITVSYKNLFHNQPLLNKYKLVRIDVLTVTEEEFTDLFESYMATGLDQLHVDER